MRQVVRRELSGDVYAQTVTESRTKPEAFHTLMARGFTAEDIQRYCHGAYVTSAIRLLARNWATNNGLAVPFPARKLNQRHDAKLRTAVRLMRRRGRDPAVPDFGTGRCDGEWTNPDTGYRCICIREPHTQGRCVSVRGSVRP